MNSKNLDDFIKEYFRPLLALKEELSAKQKKAL